MAEKGQFGGLDIVLGLEDDLKKAEEHVVLNATLLFFLGSLGFGSLELFFLYLKFGLVFDFTLLAFLIGLGNLLLYLSVALLTSSLVFS